jgi:negative regulator of flagellin synthesis FlgM
MAAELAQQGPPVDFARIAQLRQAIAQGSYAVDVDSIAHAMIGFFRAGD